MTTFLIISFQQKTVKSDQEIYAEYRSFAKAILSK